MSVTGMSAALCFRTNRMETTTPSPTGLVCLLVGNQIWSERIKSAFQWYGPSYFRTFRKIEAGSQFGPTTVPWDRFQQCRMLLKSWKEAVSDCTHLKFKSCRASVWNSVMRQHGRDYKRKAPMKPFRMTKSALWPFFPAVSVQEMASTWDDVMKKTIL